jgi:RNA polymerase sigma-70 factor (ECF subfamily)
MHTTPISLLERLRQPVQREADWRRFVRLYTPLLASWASRAVWPGEDPDDLVQDVFAVLVQKLPEFVYDPGKKSFRGWLRAVARNRWHDLHRRRRLPVRPDHGRPPPEPEGPDLFAAFEEAEYRQHLAGRALQLIQAEFPPAVWRSFWEYVVDSRPPADVARELGVTVNMVYLAKSRVLARLRQELDGLLD